jgi:hypothetical protein
MKSWLDIENDLKGCGSDAPDPKIIDMGIRFLDKLRQQDPEHPPCLVALSPNCSIVFEWQTGGYKQAEIERSGVAEWMVELENGQFTHFTERFDDNVGWFDSTVQALKNMLSLAANWDSYGAPPIDPITLSSALEFLCDAIQDDTPAPSVVPTSHGGIQIEWHTQGIDIEVEFLSPTGIRWSFERLEKQC